MQVEEEPLLAGHKLGGKDLCLFIFMSSPLDKNPHFIIWTNWQIFSNRVHTNYKFSSIPQISGQQQLRARKKPTTKPQINPCPTHPFTTFMILFLSEKLKRSGELHSLPENWWIWPILDQREKCLLKCQGLSHLKKCQFTFSVGWNMEREAPVSNMGRGGSLKTLCNGKKQHSTPFGNSLSLCTKTINTEGNSVCQIQSWTDFSFWAG